ncbi:MAG: ATP-binding cassette domain-containing protein [Gammaproteobacteria bacterium]|nr:ATP-binding cassette domain-containing protein [Gammaproteobacteria bacterium]
MNKANHNGLGLTALTTLHVGPLSWQINRGSAVSLAGESGSGKSLLLRAIADLDPHGGEMSLDGQSALSMTGHQWRQRVGLLPAEPFWWAEQVGEHFTAPGAAPLAELGLPPEAMEWSVSRCSTGERQRLALARLLQNRPEVLLLDEPTAALDPQSVERVEVVVEHYRQERNAVVIWVSHDPAQRRRVATRHYCIEHGKLTEVTV